ncbi:Glycoside hydrolase family 93 protein [Pleurostoma richardsiae]|uniref:Glycoside hydrolase family 93 protein n=1 Tax=Pleurostoma richardsiae TaxID=41990 RepID=A0AA38S031_9PEZI|nr:Glycoside hydrolase family 93 protein [Pleurostoma richardsiae]
MYVASIISDIFLILPYLALRGAAGAVKRTPQPFTDFTDNIFFYPAADAVKWKTLYARSLQLVDESLLMTWENYPKEPPLVNHPIYRSVDGGATWSNFSQIEDQVNGWGLRFQPFLYTLPQPLGNFAAGTILAAGVSAPFNLTGGVYIELYASTDEARTWNFVSHVAYGAGPETITNGNAALWEPFLLVYNGELVCFYSDQTDPIHAQQLVHRTTTDLHNWSDPVPDVAFSTYTERPGMTTVAEIKSTGQFIMTFEWCGSQGCKVHYKVASSPLEFNASTPVTLQSNDSSHTVPVGSPYVIWTPNPQKADGSGLIIASGGNKEPVFLNEDSADPGGWKMVDVGMWSAYSRSLRIITVKGAKKLLFGNGGNMGDPSANSVACGVVEIPT